MFIRCSKLIGNKSAKRAIPSNSTRPQKITSRILAVADFIKFMASQHEFRKNLRQSRLKKITDTEHNLKKNWRTMVWDCSRLNRLFFSQWSEIDSFARTQNILPQKCQLWFSIPNVIFREWIGTEHAHFPILLKILNFDISALVRWQPDLQFPRSVEKFGLYRFVGHKIRDRTSKFLHAFANPVRSLGNFGRFANWSSYSKSFF